MIISLIGHEYKYAIEQMTLTLFPMERPRFSSDHITSSGELSVGSRLTCGAVYAQATTSVRSGGTITYGAARVALDKLNGKLVKDRLLQRIIKQSFYRAAVRYTGCPPVWGSLSGIRPAKIAAAALETGAGEKAAMKILTRDYYVSPERAAMCVIATQTALDIKRSLAPRDIALYIGIPFCPTRCAYCSFVSNSVEKSFGLTEPFTLTLKREIRAVSETVRELGLRVRSVFIGGGTPTALHDTALETILSALQESFDLSEILEYTVEAGRPDTLTPRNLGIIKNYGANRVCVNPQSTSETVLRNIGRRHTPEEAIEAARMVKQTGMILNMDIIAGLPGDDPQGFGKTLDDVMALNPENITVHTLSLKKGSRIMLENIKIPGGEDVGAMLGYASTRLQSSGYSPYYLYRQKFTSGGFENTGWSLPGYHGIYNVCMMEELCTVLALGGGGVTKVVAPDGRIERIFNAKYPREYIIAAGFEDKIMKIRGMIQNAVSV